jgi:hypothetical protein
MKSTLLIATLVAMLGTSLSVTAAPDEGQRYMLQRAAAAKAKLQQAEAAKGGDRKKLMGEHMAMMKEMMEKMQAMKPKAGMNAQDHEEWMAEHQKLMAQMMEQMMGEHHLMMQSK